MICEIARQAGEKIMEIYDGDHTGEFKDDKSPLTAADKASHEVIVAGLTKHYPKIPILSEEGKDIPYEQRKNWSRFWLVDPLDGTKEFIKRNGEFTVNIALVEGNEPTIGVVYVPAQDKVYYGIKRQGAFLQQGNGESGQIQVRTTPPGRRTDRGYELFASLPGAGRVPERYKGRRGSPGWKFFETLCGG